MAEKTKTSDSHTSLQQFPEALERSWLKRLAWHFDHVNYQYLGCALKRPLFILGDSKKKLGSWDGNRRTLMISHHHILSHDWETVVDTLRHEMAHQYVQEHLGLGAAAPHGREFRDACELLRCDPAAKADAATLRKLEDSPSEKDRNLGRIKELLALAGSPNEHEAATAMRLAQKYLLKYNLDLEDLSATRNYEFLYLGDCASRVQEYQYVLSNILQEYFFVLAIWTYSYDPRRDKPGKRLQICGTKQNLEIASYVYDYVMGAARPLWDAHKTATATKKKLRGTRLQYLAGLLQGLKQKLERQKGSLEREQGLIWVGDTRLGEYYRHLNPRIRNVSGSGVARSRGYADGMRDGRKLNIRRGLRDQGRKGGGLIEGPGKGS
mgnify:CR=1 FL=1|tara:strand:- start:334 stop:1473 length:1140 start_codon:yes stop_codon:yes gene_type:complete